jgi:nicotinamide phosphoribosyltransferase
MNNKLQDTFTENFCTASDSYKIGHHDGYAKNCTNSYAYGEARSGSLYAHTLVTGLRMVLAKFTGTVFTQADIDEAYDDLALHFMDNEFFNKEGFEHLLNEYKGILPLTIRSVKEGTAVPINNVLFDIQLTRPDPKIKWLVNFVETEITHSWLPMTVASKAFFIKNMLIDFYNDTASEENYWLIDYALHDFGYRGATCAQAAMRASTAHQFLFKGTDTLIGLRAIKHYYNGTFGFSTSVYATEHSQMTQWGIEGEIDVIVNALDKHQYGITSFVSDSYDYYNNVREYVGITLKERILQRYADGITTNKPTKYVVRPDSCTPDHKTPESLVIWTLDQLGVDFGFTVNKKGHKELNPAVGVIWGDGIDVEGMRLILQAMKDAGWAATNCLFGMGGGLQQKHDRDTQRFAFKCAAQLRDGVWVDIKKNPLDKSKVSKAGRLALTKDDNGVFITVREDELGDRENFLVPIFIDGRFTDEITFCDAEEVRERVGGHLNELL